ncbi:hypothetical protein [Streptomyces sp. NPDC051014]|uniref:hypothetical protein n=1 Tax=Streptomyces sp. NPDC051014 TaxID=3155751 RepID=UPI0033CC8303
MPKDHAADAGETLGCLLYRMDQELGLAVRSLRECFAGRTASPEEAVEQLCLRLAAPAVSPDWAASGFVDMFGQFLAEGRAAALLESIRGIEHPPFQPYDHRLATEAFYFTFLDQYFPAWSDLGGAAPAAGSASEGGRQEFRTVDLHDVFADSRVRAQHELERLRNGPTEEERWAAALRQGMVTLGDIVEHNKEALKRLRRKGTARYSLYQWENRTYLAIEAKGIAEIYAYGTAEERNPVDSGTLTLLREGKTLCIPTGRLRGAGCIEVTGRDASWALAVEHGLKETDTAKDIVHTKGP